MVSVARKFVMVTLLALLVTGLASAAAGCQPAMTAHNLPGHDHDQPCHVSQTSVLQGEFGSNAVSATLVVAAVSAPVGFPKSANDVSRQLFLSAPAPSHSQLADQSILCTFRV